MPKMKTHRGAAKRFRKTGKAKIRRNRAYASHLLGKKSSKQKRRLRQPTILTSGEKKRVKKMIPYK